MDTDTPSDVRLALYVRSLVPRGPQSLLATVQDRLETLQTDDAIDSYTVTVCGRQIPASVEAARTDVGATLANEVELFREWARRNGASLPTIRDRSVSDRILEEHYEAIEWPKAMLAEFRGPDLALVAPHRSDDSVVTITDRLDTLAEEKAPAYTPVRRSQDAEIRRRIKPHD